MGWDKVRPIYYQFGPKFSFLPQSSIQVFSKYSDNSFAGIVSNSGKGKVILLGHHPEATKEWTEDDNTLTNAGDWEPTDDLSDNLFALARR